MDGGLFVASLVVGSAMGIGLAALTALLGL